MLFYLLGIILGILIDQVTKYFAAAKLALIPTLPLINNVFHLTYATNTGGAFSLLNNHPAVLTLFSLALLILMLTALWVMPKTKRYTLLNLSMTLIAAGAVGNIIDRLRLGYVVDFFDFRLINFAIFNVADIFVVCGCFGIVIAIWTNRIPQSRQELRPPFGKAK